MATEGTYKKAPMPHNKVSAFPEPSVINEDMILKEIELQLPSGEAGEWAKIQGSKLEKVTYLRLEVKSILKISNLDRMVGLTRLQLAVNKIEDIEGLDSLVNLEWLDLSFNNIKQISGLDNLLKLTVLNLHSNLITNVQNLGHLQEITVFSIGKNKIEDFNQLIDEVRKLPKISSVFLAGNPFCKSNPDYPAKIFAFIDKLRYLNGRLIPNENIVKAVEKYKDDLAADQDDSANLAFSLGMKVVDPKEQERKLQLQKLHTEAFMDGLYQDELYNILFENDKAGQLIAEVGKNPKISEEFRYELTKLTTVMFEEGMAEHYKRRIDIDDYHACIKDVRARNTAMATKKVDEFLTFKRETLRQMNEISNSKEKFAAEAKNFINPITDALQTQFLDMQEVLTRLELQYLDQVEDSVKEFARGLRDAVNLFLEPYQNHFALLKECQLEYSSKSKEEMMDNIDDLKLLDEDDELGLNEQEDEDEPIEIDAGIQRDIALKMVNNSNEAHIAVIELRQERLNKDIRTWIDDYTNAIFKEEEDRHRRRLLEIDNLLESIREELAEVKFFDVSIALDRQPIALRESNTKVNQQRKTSVGLPNE